MSRPLRIEYPGAFYHVTARGNERRAIFRDDADRERYLKCVARCRDRFAFRLHAYCLMTNHLHLAIEASEVPLSRIMLTLHGSYSQAFNRRHRRVGHLFQGRYKAFLVQKDRYLLALVRYIHENPVKARIVKKPEDFRWSSDRAYRRPSRPEWLETDFVLSLLADRRRPAVRRYIALMARRGPSDYDEVPTFGGVIRGDEDFAVRIGATADPEVIVRSLTPERVARLAANALGVSVDQPSDWRLRAITGYVGRQRGRIPLTKTASFFGKHGTTLVRDVRRLEAELPLNDSTRRLVDSLQARLASAAIQR
ncbi:MAG TPA: transposase [Thermoanaerobaculia bacterium]|nr:transposase [Thermoanaerobaculia bacterium]